MLGERPREGTRRRVPGPVSDGRDRLAALQVGERRRHPHVMPPLGQRLARLGEEPALQRPLAHRRRLRELRRGRLCLRVLHQSLGDGEQIGVVRQSQGSRRTNPCRKALVVGDA